ncbi:6-aminohexanoate-dimer hydrolase [Thioalkalivibrio sulfidiphilus HL-EbGr7]|uniref:6-aminohexanoate-dimer hydrolase n=2 Tax=Thioalkalivibrio TaxID=106633 RepID=B8GT11_THISH|nr:6-aminohexanoate-dimer hydrolase [Thioalkalivibrio sulfidiphilus HL-EbGr7]
MSVHAQEASLTARESDPRVMGWMQGVPPAPDKRISVAAGDFFAFPKSRWSVCHMRELFPTIEVSRGIGAPVPLDYVPHHEFADIRAEIDALTFTPMDGDEEMTWAESLAANYTDGILILHKGQVVYEWYSGCLSETGQHAMMSMTKSLVGLLAEILVAEGRLDDDAPVTDYVPELADTAFGSASVRQVMDMTTALAFDENYDDPNADIWAYSAAGNPLPKPPGYDGPIGYIEYLQTVERDGRHGVAFGYKTINTDVLAWIVARVTGMTYTQALSDMLWSRMGAEQSAYITGDAVGTPFAGGGMSAGLRDLGRLGLLLLNEGVINGERLFPADVVESIRAGGSRRAFARAGFDTLAGGSYRSMFWVFHNDNGAFAARGVYGQTIYVDPAAEMVLVRLASYPKPKNALIDPTSLPAYQAVADYLMSSRSKYP